MMFLVASISAAAVLLITPLLLVIMLLPAILEFKRPKDAGPRPIMLDLTLVVPKKSVEVCSLVNLEEPHELDCTLKPFVNVILGNLPSLDA
ncbi:MAG: hypothetical protein NWF00_04775 [Candidatus Bathyarchaeota archaeon]|nr:hypothetical protein [Candidatus Bathyarchaeota archaeon]